MRGGRLQIDWEQAAGAATVGGLFMAIGQWFAAHRESAKKRRVEEIAEIAVAVVRKSGEFPLAEVQKVLNKQFSDDIAAVTDRVENLNNYVRGELPKEIARHITENGIRLHVDPSKD
jgi:hypothetical protein